MFKTALGERKVRQQVCPFAWINGVTIRESRAETLPGFFKCASLKRALACDRQVVDQSPIVAEGSRLAEMVSDVSGAFDGRACMEPLDRVSNAGVQLLSPRGGDLGKQRLTHKLMGEGKRPVRALGTWDDYSHLLRLLDGGETII